jgi:hypothetical protein
MMTALKKKVKCWSFRVLVPSLFACLLSGYSFGQSAPAYDRVEVGALDPDAWNGIFFLARAFNQPTPFALRFGSWHKKFIDGEQIYEAVSEVGPHAPDASYCRMSWRHPPRTAPITLEWSRINPTTVVGRLTAEADYQLVLETYFPSYEATWGTQGFYSIDEAHRAMVGERYFDNVFGTAARLVVMIDRPLSASGIYPTLAKLRDNMNATGKLVSSITYAPNAGAGGMEFATDGTPVHFVATLGWERDGLMQQAQDLLAGGKIDAILKEKSDAYAARRPTVAGLFEGAPEAIGNSMLWTSTYAPANGMIFPSVSRRWAHEWGGWAIGGWDTFFNALLTSLEDPMVTASGIKAILLAQTPDGLVPNVASGIGMTPDRSEPPVGAYGTWKVYQRTQDRALLEWAYPRLLKWHERWFNDRGDGQPWRDGNRDGLLEWGSDRGSTSSVGGRGYLQAAKFESGMDDSPLWDEAVYDPHTYTLNLDSVDLNSLYALDAECLSKIAAILGKDDDARKLSADYERMKQRVREKLWNEKDGIYEDRFWNGQFSKHLAPTNFYPLLAGIATPEQAKRMIEEHLLNPQEFWGTYVAPSIARNDPAFQGQFYVRGNIWPMLNYLLYEGISRYGFDQVALEFARKNYDLFMNEWKASQLSSEQYYAWGGTGGGHPQYTWGALLCLIALEQYIDVNPWEGLRFGALNPPASGEFRHVTWNGHAYDVTIGPQRTALTCDGKARFEANAGVVVRAYQVEPRRISFRIKGDRPSQIETREFDSGEFNLNLDGKPAGRVTMRQGRGEFAMPAGEHTVELRQ